MSPSELLHHIRREELDITRLHVSKKAVDPSSRTFDLDIGLIEMEIHRRKHELRLMRDEYRKLYGRK